MFDSVRVVLSGKQLPRNERKKWEKTTVGLESAICSDGVHAILYADFFFMFFKEGALKVVRTHGFTRFFLLFFSIGISGYWTGKIELALVTRRACLFDDRYEYQHRFFTELVFVFQGSQ